MWGFVRLLDSNHFGHIPFDETGIPPLDPRFTIERFNTMLDTYPEKDIKGIKGFLVATGHVMKNHIHGLGNAIIQDILFLAKIHPKRKINEISPEERKELYNTINQSISEVIRYGGRYDERDLYDHPGGYIRIMDNKSVGTPCPGCGNPIEKVSYLGGTCYICPRCQPLNIK